jgi:predicted Rossmann-fold nucleotide-binding protein
MEAALKAIAVFCGSSTGVNPAYGDAAEQLGGLIAQQGFTLVYGGAQVGVMGRVANAALAVGGRVIGVIPQSLTLTERKQVMMALSDAFAVLPGGIGTMDELFEVWTATQLGLQSKPCGLLNTLGYFDPLIVFLDHCVSQGFLRPAHRDLLRVEHLPVELLGALSRH